MLLSFFLATALGVNADFILEEGRSIYTMHPIYSQITDIFHPTIEDYRLVQEFLTYGEHENIEALKDKKDTIKNLKITGNNPDQVHERSLIAINCDEDARENCIIAYASFNGNFIRGLKRLLEYTRKSDYKGHFLYWIGGWPNTEGGSLVLAHVPWAFKVSAFKEAQNLGFKRVLWLDCSIIPVASPNLIFDMIDEAGYFVCGNTHVIGWYINPDTANYFGVPMKDTYEIPSCSAGLFGVDFTKPIGGTLIDDWYRAAHDKHAFFSARSDQNALTLVLYNNNIKKYTGYGRVAENVKHINENTLFLLDRGYVW